MLDNCRDGERCAQEEGKRERENVVGAPTFLLGLYTFTRSDFFGWSVTYADYCPGEREATLERAGMMCGKLKRGVRLLQIGHAPHHF